MKRKQAERDGMSFVYILLTTWSIRTKMTISCHKGTRRGTRQLEKCTLQLTSWLLYWANISITWINNLLDVLFHLIYPNVQNDNWRETGLWSQRQLCIMHVYRQPRSRGSLLPVPREREMGRRENLGTRLVYRHSWFIYFIFYWFTGVITHTGCWENTRKASKSRGEGEWFILASFASGSSRR